MVALSTVATELVRHFPMVIIEREAASPPPITDVTTAVTTGLATTATNAMSVISSVLPYALAIVGAVIVVGIGIKIFKRVSGR